MTYLVVDQRVTDVDGWVAAFSAATGQRGAAGGELAMVLTDPADPGRLLVIVEFDTPEHAREWRARPGIEQAGARVGVVPGSVTARVLDELPMPQARPVE